MGEVLSLATALIQLAVALVGKQKASELLVSQEAIVEAAEFADAIEAARFGASLPRSGDD